eukprot:356534-Chlamydomonas_euryale.AAC.5
MLGRNAAMASLICEGIGVQDHVAMHAGALQLAGKLIRTFGSLAACPRVAPPSSRHDNLEDPAWTLAHAVSVTHICAPHGTLLSGNSLAGGDDSLLSDAKLRVQLGCRRRCAERVDANELALEADVAVPAERSRSLNGDARGDGRGQHRVLVLLALLLEQLEARHRHDAHLEASGRQVNSGTCRKLQLRAGANEDDVGLALGAAARHDVAALSDAVSRRARQVGHVLA